MRIPQWLMRHSRRGSNGLPSVYSFVPDVQRSWVHLRFHESRTVVPPMQYNGKYAKLWKGHRVRLFPSSFVHSGQRHESFRSSSGRRFERKREKEGEYQRLGGDYVRFSSVYALRRRGRESEWEALPSAHGMNVQWHVSNTQHACSWREVVVSYETKE